MRIGIGYDIHRLTSGRQMVLGGVSIPFHKGPEGHSDGDVLLHAVIDAILGALALEDIGMRFPDREAKYKDISSRKLLKHVDELMRKKGYRIGNIDCVVISEEPKVSPYRTDIINAISSDLGVPKGDVNVKGKTSERLGSIGSGDAIAAYAVVLLERVG